MAALRRLSTTAGAGDLHFLPRLSSFRSYQISAAQPQFDYDRHYNNTDYDSGADGRAYTSPEMDTDSSTPIRDVRWVFIGSPYAKKHVYAGMISNLLEVPHISITSLLRQDLSPHSPIAEAVNHGKLVPESIIFGLLSKRLEDGHCRGETGFILDGIPRTRLQAEVLDQLVNIDLVVNFRSSKDMFHAGRSTPDSSMSYSRNKTSFSSPGNATEDSNPNISTFHREQMKLLAEYYQGQKKLIDFQVGNAPAETWKGLVSALHLQHINAVRSSQLLTMGFHKTLRY